MGKVKHGMANTKIYKKWKDMKRRCNNENRKDYKNYGAIGIKVCEEWEKDFLNFYNWSLENGYVEGLSLERKNVNEGYNPSNCCWIPLEEQMKNQRRSRRIEINGITKNLSEWAKETNIAERTIYDRYKRGWRGEDLIKEKQVSFTGYHHSEESKKKISEKLKVIKKGIKHSEETKRKISETKRNKNKKEGDAVAKE